jgi:dolichol-phosphate mannosyltransferase
VRLIVVIPTYNEAENLPRLVSALFDLRLNELQILIVDDNSPDGSGRLAEELAQKYIGRMQVLHRTGKLGLGTAYLGGFRQAMQMGAQAIAQMDADFSHPPEKLPILVEALECCDVALGSRYIPGGSVDVRWPLWRKGLSAFGNLYARSILGIPIQDVTGGFRVWRRETLAGMPLECVQSNGYAFQVEMIYLAHLLGYVASEIPFYFADRRWGQSKMSFRIQREAAVRVWRIFFEYRGFKRQR